MDYLNIKDLLETTLAQPLSDSATTMTVSAELATLPIPFVVNVAVGRDLTSLRAGEMVRVAARDSVNPLIWTLTRAFDGTTARAHVAGELVLVSFASVHHQMLLDTYEFLGYAFGRAASGIIRRDNAVTGDLYVAATTGMVVNVKTGLALIDRKPFKLAVNTNLTIVAPTTNSRIALIQANLLKNTVEIKYGTQAASPVAPAVDASCLSLATIATTVGMSSIVQGNITQTGVYY